MDRFAGNGPVSGRFPLIGPAWGVTGQNASGVVTVGDEMTQNTAGGASFATSDTGTLYGEVGCTFRLASIYNSMVVGGSPTVGGGIGANITPSGVAGFYQVSYTLVAGDTLASAATAFADAINANSFLQPYGVAATANGTTVSVSATETAQLAVFSFGGPTLSSLMSDSPVLTSYPTGQNMSNGMLHFRLGVDGVLDWEFYINGVTPFATITRKTRGLAVGIVYTYRCCIAPPYVWGGIWDGSTLLSAVWAQDPNIGNPAYRGASCGFENGPDANTLYFDSVWAYPQPSIPLSTIQAAV